MARLREKYREEVVPELMKEFSYSNIMQVPELEKIVINIGLGEALDRIQAFEVWARRVTAVVFIAVGVYETLRTTLRIL